MRFKPATVDQVDGFLLFKSSEYLSARSHYDDAMAKFSTLENEAQDLEHTIKWYNSHGVDVEVNFPGIHRDLENTRRMRLEAKRMVHDAREALLKQLRVVDLKKE